MVMQESVRSSIDQVLNTHVQYQIIQRSTLGMYTVSEKDCTLFYFFF